VKYLCDSKNARAAWAQYKAKLLGLKSVSEYIFQLIAIEKEKEKK